MKDLVYIVERENRPKCSFVMVFLHEHSSVLLMGKLLVSFLCYYLPCSIENEFVYYHVDTWL